MFRYSIQAIKDEEDNLFHCVFEHHTQQIVDLYYFLDDAKNRMLFLESGGAFDGFTPSFILRPSNPPKDINSSFMEIVNEN